MELPQPKKSFTESAQERRVRLDKRNERRRAKRLAESIEEREERRRKRNCKDRARRSTETPLEKKSRLDKRKCELASESLVQRASRLQNASLYKQQLLKAESQEQRSARQQNMRILKKQHFEAESEDQRQARLQKMKVNQQHRLEAETETERQTRLKQLKMNQQHRLDAETESERQARLEQLKMNQQHRLASETEAERQARLEQLKVNRKQQLSNETSEDKEARLKYKKQQLQAETLEESLLRLHRMSTRQRERLESETPEHRSARLMSRNASKRIPLLNDGYANEKITKFHDKISTIESPSCSICLEHFPGTKMASNSTVCLRCFRDKKHPKLFSAENNMSPGPVPTELQGLSQVEEMLISLVIPIMSVYRLPHGQYGYKGHVINLPQDITTFATSLPRIPEELDILIVRKKGSDNSHRDFKVRRAVVLNALLWLKQHNKYYRKVNIDYTALNGLPEDGHLSNHSGMKSSTCTEEEDGSLLENPDEQDHDTESFIPMAAPKLTELDAVKQSIQDKQKKMPPTTVCWPPRADAPVNEFVTEGYMSCAFPTLFPTGAADFLAPRERAVTVGNYFKHLMKYEDGRFATHPRFRYFALNSEMRWRALQAGRVYIKQHPKDARLSLDELKSIVDCGGEQFSKKVLHYACNLRGTKQYWFKQRIRLVAMIDKLGLPTIFFTHSAADGHWPELARLICKDNPENSSCRSRAVNNNPAIADWFFFERISEFVEMYYVDLLGATDYWLRFEWQHRGSPHVHGLAWLPNAPDAEKLLTCDSSSQLLDSVDGVIAYVDELVSTMNPGIPANGNNLQDAVPQPKTNPHVCNRSYGEITDMGEDLIDLIATCQRHTRCSTSYCLKKKKGKQECRFGFPKPLQPVTYVTSLDDGEPVVLTKRNDNLLNGYNPVQLSAWRANVDMQYVVSRQKVTKYVAKYATKSEPRSTALQEVYRNIMKSIDDDGTPLKVVQKLLTSTVGERDFSAQETCHLLLMLPMVKSSRDFVVLSLEGSREVDANLEEDKPVTLESQLDQYCARPDTIDFNQLTLLQFVERYKIPKKKGDAIVIRKKEVLVIPRPYCSSDPEGPNYEQYCKQQLMLHQPFRQLEDLLAGHEHYTDAYSFFLKSGRAPTSLADDIQRLETAQKERCCNNEDESDEDQDDSNPVATFQDWMLLCGHQQNLEACAIVSSDGVDWTAAAKQYDNVGDMPSFVAQLRQCEDKLSVNNEKKMDPSKLQGKQLEAFNVVKKHLSYQDQQQPLKMIVSGTAGTGKSYLIGCLQELLGEKLCTMAPTGAAAYNVHGHTLHSLLKIPVRGDFKELEGQNLHNLQESLDKVSYIILDEMSMVGRKLFGQMDRRLRQAFPCRSNELFGGCSCLLFGDWGQLPPVMDLPLYTTVSRSELSDLGSINYHQFNHAITLSQVMRQAGENDAQKLFRGILLRLRNGELTISDWKHLMEQTLAEIEDPAAFDNAIRLFPTTVAVAEYNVAKLHSIGQPVAVIKAIHSGPGASKVSADDAGGLEPVVCLAQGARVMLTANLCVQAGLVNGATGTVLAVCYDGADESPPSLPVAVTVQFDSYRGPTLHDGSVPIVPLRRMWMSSDKPCSRLQLPLKLAWAVTIHKCQGMTLSKVVIDVGKREFSAGLTFVACSRVRELKDLLFVPPFPYQRVANLASGRRHSERLREEKRLEALHNKMSCEITQPTLTTTPVDAGTMADQADIATQHKISTHEVLSPTACPVNLSSQQLVSNIPNLPKCMSQADEGAITCVLLNPKLAENLSPNVPLAGKDKAREVLSQLEITRVEQNNDCLKYYPGDVEWQLRTCQELGLEYRRPNGIEPGSLSTPLTSPTGFKSISGDGNCMFRAFSFIITGSEDQHMQVRQAIIHHMRAIGTSLWESQVSPLLQHLYSLGEVSENDYRSSCAETTTNGVDRYIAATKMDCDRTWGSEVEIMVLSNLLNTALYTYDTNYGWSKHIPSNVHGRFDVSTYSDSRMSMYVRHDINHYDVITSVQ